MNIDSEFLLYLIRKKNIDMHDLAREVGIAYQTLLRKINGLQEFRLSEVQKIYNVLEMSAEEAIHTFLSQDVNVTI